MKVRSYVRSCSGARDGIALVMVLAFIVLLTILLVSFIAFTRLNKNATVSYSKSIQAQEIAQGGLQDILSDVRNEIIAGSVIYNTNSTGVPYNNSYASVFRPINNYTSVPARFGYPQADWATTTTPGVPTLPPSLIRVSRASQDDNITDFYPPYSSSSSPPYASYYTNMASVCGGTILNRASNANTANPSANGRSISVARWNKSYLLAFQAAYVPTDFSQTGGPPDWVYVTRTGSRACPPGDLPYLISTGTTTNPTATYTIVPGQNPPASPVVGRYAYIMYDEGSLIDINAGGVPSTSIGGGASMPTTPPTYTTGSPPPSYADSKTGIITEVLGKSNVSQADLSQINNFSQTYVDALLNWRSYGGIHGVSTGVGDPFLSAVFNNARKNFLSFTPGDSPLLSRQDLINFFLNLNAIKKTTSLTLPLSGLGTFSRAISAPTYSPPSDASALGGRNDPGGSPDPGAIYAYHTNAENFKNSPFTSTSPNPNRDLANVRFQQSGTVTHYFDDQTAATPTATYTVNRGDPLLQSRFSLAKIGWLKSTTLGGMDPGGVSPYANPTQGPSPTYAGPIQACFGLTWVRQVGSVANGGNACWEYVGSPVGVGGHAQVIINGVGTAVIETLDQVALENREPNFFELLKAAILSGSVGLSPGPAGWNNAMAGPYDFRNGEGATYTYTGGVDSLDAYSFDRANYAVGQAPLVPAPASIPDVQIIKIGADIIDQYGADNYPTAIYFSYPGINAGGFNFDASTFTPRTGTGTLTGAGDFNGPSTMVFGEKNLPYLQSVFDVAGTPTSDPGPYPTGSGTVTLQGWMQPQVWNPHLQPVNPSTALSNNTPTKYMIAGYGTGGFTWTNNSNKGASSGTGLTRDLDGSTITIVDSNPTASIFYPQPVPLTTTLGSVTVTAQPGTGLTQPDMIPSTSLGFSKNSLVGFCWGEDPNYWCDNTTNTGTTTTVTPTGTVTSTYQYQPTAQVRASQATGLTFVMGWVDIDGGFHPYSYLPQLLGYSYSVLGPEKGDDERGSDDYSSTYSEETHVMLDPRTYRFSDLEGWGWWYPGGTFGLSDSDNSGQGRPINSNFTFPGFINTGPIASQFPHAWEVGWIANAVSPPSQTGLFGPAPGLGVNAQPGYYSDMDGVIRPADGIYGKASTGDGNMLSIVAGAPSGNSGPNPVGDSTITQHGRRPVILNRPFRSVAEMGYAFRDLPFKTLDFFSTVSADAALLDVFSLTDEASVQASQINSVVAGQVNLSNASVPVLQALLSLASKKDSDPNYYMSTASGPPDASDIATAIANQLQPSNTTVGGGPLLNRANLVTTLGSTLVSSAALYNQSDQRNKAYMEAPVRALVDVANTRTWNLMIDIIAQSGQMSPNAKTLNDFVVQGERRYWLHIAIDRYTGKIIDQQLEQVYE